MDAQTMIDIGMLCFSAAFGLSLGAVFHRSINAMRISVMNHFRKEKESIWDEEDKPKEAI